MRPDHHDHHVWPCFVVVEGKSSNATSCHKHIASKPVKNMYEISIAMAMHSSEIRV